MIVININAFFLCLITVGIALGGWFFPELGPYVVPAFCLIAVGLILKRLILGPGKPRNTQYCYEHAQTFIDYVLAQRAYLLEAVRSRPSFVSFSAERDAVNIDGKDLLCPIVTAEFPVREGLIAVCRYVVRIDRGYEPTELLPVLIELIDVRNACDRGDPVCVHSVDEGRLVRLVEEGVSAPYPDLPEGEQRTREEATCDLTASIWLAMDEAGSPDSGEQESA